MSARTIHRPRAALAGLGLAIALGGCASFSDDGGMASVQALSRERVGQAPRMIRSDDDAQAVRTRIAELLRTPLGVASATELALLNHRGLQAELHQLGVAEADLVAAGRLRNPVFGFLDLHSDSAYKIERSLVFDVVGLLTMPRRTALARTAFEQAQLQAAASVVATATEARRAWIAAVASGQQLDYARQVMEAAELSSALAARMAQAGNLATLARLREQAFHADAATRLARAQHQALADRERLARALGLWGDQLAFTLPDRLPDLPAAPEAPRELERMALEKRLDVLAARRASAALAQSLGLTRVTRVVDGFHLGYANMSEGGDRLNGYELSLELPLFDWGQSRVARAQSLYMQSLERTAQTAIDARSQVRTAYSAYRTAYDVARHHRDEVVPVARRISEETLLRYNGMLVGPFELLADAREQVRSVASAIEAQREFWLADADLQTVLTAGPPSGEGGPRQASLAPRPAASASH